MNALLPFLLLATPKGTAILPTAQLAANEYGTDAPWFQANVPFFDCSDKKIEEIYAYRWKLYKAHIRNLGDKGYLITEFLDDVGWQKHPYAMLNDATAFHLYEGRWLRDRRYLDGFIQFLYPGGGNDRHFSESIADGVNAYTLANGDSKWAIQFLPAMQHIYNLWDDHYDFSKGLYWVEPLLDATEYTVSSIDATNGRDGFFGGQAFRPTINSYMVANARAIARFAALAGDQKTARDYVNRAVKLRATMLVDLWNPKLGHYTDRYQVNNQFVKYWDFVRDRELEGYVPWTYALPPDSATYTAAWKHLLSPDGLAGPYGIRTVGPSFQYYMRQYRYEGKNPECQWNGPSWPFQTTQALLAMANLLDGYHQSVVKPTDYVRLLQQYTAQHYLDGKPNLQEDYNPDTGRPIVGLARSQHYNHSGYTDLVITGLCGLRPHADNTLDVNPIAEGLPFFCLENVAYHGHAVTILWDASGRRYGKGSGLTVFVDGQKRARRPQLGRLTINLSAPIITRPDSPLNLATNIYRTGYPQPSGSSDLGNSLWQAVDGRAWFYPELVRGWSPASGSTEDWYAIDFGEPKTVREVRLSLYGTLPEKTKLQAWFGTSWKDIASPKTMLPSTANILKFPQIKTTKLRAVFNHQNPIRLVELEAY